MTTLVFRDRRRASSVRRMLRSAFLILLFYLLQSCVVPHLKVMGVMPNPLMVTFAVDGVLRTEICVCCRRVHRHCAGVDVAQPDVVLRAGIPNAGAAMRPGFC